MLEKGGGAGGPAKGLAPAHFFLSRALIDDVRVAIKHLKNLNLIVLMVYFLIILLMELNCYFLIFLCYLE